MVEAREDTPAPRRVEVVARRWREHLWRIIVTTVGSCLRHRVTGLAAEAAFFAVLSVPPLIFALAGAVGFVSEQFSATQIDDVRNAVLEVSRQALTERAVSVMPIEPGMPPSKSNARLAPNARTQAAASTANSAKASSATPPIQMPAPADAARTKTLRLGFDQ